MMTPEKQTAVDWVGDNESALSDWHQTIWRYAEPAWREYKSAALYVERLRAEGFTVEESSAGMPTAFCATWGDRGPVIGGYAEYDAVPGQSQQQTRYRAPYHGAASPAPGSRSPAECAARGTLSYPPAHRPNAGVPKTPWKRLGLTRLPWRTFRGSTTV